jgi:hypothetical protein
MAQCAPMGIFVWANFAILKKDVARILCIGYFSGTVLGCLL